MSHQFKPGDLAMITGAITKGGEVNIGKVVELIVRVPHGCFVEVAGKAYLSEYGDGWVVRGDGLTGRRVHMITGQEWFEPTECAFPVERFLMPLRGDFTPEQQKAKEAEPCL